MLTVKRLSLLHTSRSFATPFSGNTFAYRKTAFTSSYFPLFCNPFSGNTFAYRKTAFTSVYLPSALLHTSRSFATPFSGNTFAYRKTAFTSVYLPPALRCISESLQFTGKRFRCFLRCRRICICAPRIYLTLLQNRHFETCCMQQRKNASSAARFFAQNDSGSFLSLSFTDKKARPLSRRTRTKSLNSGSQDDIYESAGY